MRDRLIELIAQADKKCEDTKQCEDCSAYGKGQECINRLIAEHLLANGVIVPPCKVGDDVYYIIDGKIQPLSVKYGTFVKRGITMTAKCKDEDDMCEVGCWVDGKTCRIGFDYSHIGKTVFLTKEKAEQALKEREQ